LASAMLDLLGQRKRLLLGHRPVDPEAAGNKEMTEDFYRDILGITPPSEKDHRPFIDLIDMAVKWAHKHKNAPTHITDPEADLVIYISFLATETECWKSTFRDSQNYAGFHYRDPNTHWRTIAMGVSTRKSLQAAKKLLPSLDTEIYSIETRRPPLSQKITPGPTPISSIITPLMKRIPRPIKPRLPTVTDFILRHSPSQSYEQVYLTTLGCCKNKKSAKGRKVYPYGQRYIAKLTRLSLPTVTRAWAWLHLQGIFNKAWNENPEKHRCAGWYVCTSMKQVSYFRDPENRHRRFKRQD